MFDKDTKSRDVDDYRKMICEHSDIHLLDNMHTFYYDETGNIRKFKLTQLGVNAEEGIDNDFILGGVLFKGTVPSCDFEQLHRKLKLNVNEFKFKTLAGRGGNFWTAIKKTKILDFFQWLEQSDLLIHYTTLNNIHYAIVDMVDSLFVTQSKFNFNMEWQKKLKAKLHKFVRENLNEVFDIFIRYEYPNLAKESIKAFCYEFCDLIQCYGNEDFHLEAFRQMLKENGRRNELSLIVDNVTGLLVEDYAQLRINRCIFFSESMHYFDEEEEAEKSFRFMPFTYKGEKLKNYEFIDSKKDILIQISDVWVGLLAKLFYMLDNSDEIYIIKKLSELGEKEKECIRIICLMINRSEKLNRALLQNINSIDIIQHRGNMLCLMESKLK